jgi:hypothetical protein
MHIYSTSQFSTFAKNGLRSSARLGLEALAGLALAVTASLLMSGVASAGTPAPITVSLPIDTFDTSVPIATVIIKGVGTTNIDASVNYIGFQGDFTFNETVVTFSAPFVQKAGITGGNWNVSGNVLPGPGPIRTLRISAYSNDFTALSGSGTLFELRMKKVSQAAQGTRLIWAAPPDHFIFIDADLNTQKPGNATPGSANIGEAQVSSGGLRHLTNLNK